MFSKGEVEEKEKAKLRELFQDVEPTKASLVEGLIDDAAFLKAENQVLRQLIRLTGFIRAHPDHPTVQRTVPELTQYLKKHRLLCAGVMYKWLQC